ncbi:unnamed protein product [Cladocopium goreaui]|uniref:Uncharacterized protein n=1 Tax=Cladocopium goreaui TaxID=2562237 RepID=A0A9P1D0E9_9DINO|nr:unnamed protein product [Cladocopium goreaui]
MEGAKGLEHEDGFYVVQEFNVDDPTDLITVVDLPNRRMLECKARHLVPVDTKWCPENQVSEFGQFFICFTACLFLYLLMLYFCNLHKARVQYWSLLLMFWFSDLAAGLSTGMQGQMYYPTGATEDRLFMRQTFLLTSFIQQLGIAFFFELISFIWPMEMIKFLLERCCGCAGRSVRGGAFIVVTFILGLVNAYIAIAVAYTPASIVVVGHHPLLLGFVNFLLDIPYKLVETRIKRFLWSRCCGEEDAGLVPEYVAPELDWLGVELAEALPEEFVLRQPAGSAQLLVVAVD